jgi:hypothetical protein
MNYQERCSHCGHINTAYVHKLNIPLVRALRQLVDFYENNHKGCNLQKDINLTKNQYNNFQKLQYFGLVNKTAHGWFPTDLGNNFILGKEKCQDISATMESIILPLTHEAWKTNSRYPKMISVSDIDIFSYKKREEYKLEKSLNLFS